jgi:hypothetical protein
MYNDRLISKQEKQNIINSLEMKNLISLAASFVDSQTLTGIHQLIIYLTTGDQDSTDIDYTPSTQENFLTRIKNLTFSNEPRDEYIKKICHKYKHNLERIEELKKKQARLSDEILVLDISNKINHYKEENFDLIEKVNDYRNKQIAFKYY